MKKKLAVLLAAVMSFSAVIHATDVDAAKPTEPEISVMCVHPIERINTLRVPQSSYKYTHQTEKGECTVTVMSILYRTICFGCGKEMTSWTSQEVGHSIVHN